MIIACGRCPSCNHSDKAESIPHLVLDSKAESGVIANLRCKGREVNLLRLFSIYPRHIQVYFSYI
jgi:hypothetical protein